MAGRFMDRLIELAKKLDDIGEEVSYIRKMIRVKDDRVKDDLVLKPPSGP